MLLLFLLALLATARSSPHEDSLKFCESYAECNSVALLEERLCIGNSNKRPYWLPDSHDPQNCHDKLKNDYKVIDKMEEDLDGQYLACLTENATPMDTAKKSWCTPRILREVPRFTFLRTITYVPTNCFTGLERRRQRECGAARVCCNSYERCKSLLTDSSLAKTLETIRINMRKRAKDCEAGLAVPLLPGGDAYSPSHDPEASWAPSGYVNVRVNDQQTQLDKERQQNEVSEGNKTGFVNVRFSTSGSNSSSSNVNETAEEHAARVLQREGDSKQGFNSHGDGALGEVSNPTGGDHFKKTEFPKLNSGNRVSEEENTLVVDQGALTIGQKPKNPPLSFPDEKSKKTTASLFADKRSSAEQTKTPLSSKEREEDQRKRANLPKDLDTHDEKFAKALEHTNDYKGKIEKLKIVSTAEIANEGVESLLQAGQASSNTIGVASGKVAKVLSSFGSSEESEYISNENVVTSSPLIMVPKESNKLAERATGCGARALSAKTLKFEKILTLLGEDATSKDMKEIKDLIDAWQNNFRKKVVTAKDKARNKEIERALEGLIKHFDDVNLTLNKSQVNATFDSEDYPTEDAEITANECNPLPDEKDQGKKVIREELPSTTSIPPIETTLSQGIVNEHGDTVVNDDGVEKIILSGGSLQVAKSEDGVTNSVNQEDFTDQEEEATTPSSSSSSEETSTPWSNDEYRKELDKYRKEHKIDNNDTVARNETSCDAYMRCRTQMHLAVDGCAWRFASGKMLSSLAESAESLLYKGEEPCDPEQQPLYEELYEMIIQRNGKLRTCLDRKNEEFFSDSVCLPYEKSEQEGYDRALLRILTADYKEPVGCYRDANRIQEKCTKLRECCPNFDYCREENMDIPLEQAILSMTARINDSKQDCIKGKARDAFKETLRGLLGKGGRETIRMIKNGRMSLDIVKGAQLLRRMRR